MHNRMETTVEITRTVGDPMRVPFAKMAAAILPKGYQLSIVICGDRLAQRMNKRYRRKTYRPNVLAFPLSRKEGEIFLNIRKAAREAARERISRDTRIALLLVHGCLHLAGYSHGKRMENLEQKILTAFGPIPKR